jgi:hypothetical protein
VSEPALFDTEPLRVEQPETPAMTGGERRRQRFAIGAANGVHPLGVVFNTHIKLHPQAAPWGDQAAPGLRCGGCIFRRQQHGGARDYPKCMNGGGALATHGESSDVPRYWPACQDYSATPEVPRVQPVPRPATGTELMALVEAGVLVNMAGQPLRARWCLPCDGVHVGTTCPRAMYCWGCETHAGKPCTTLKAGHHQERVDAAQQRDRDRQAEGDPNVAAPWPVAS